MPGSMSKITLDLGSEPRSAWREPTYFYTAKRKKMFQVVEALRLGTPEKLPVLPLVGIHSTKISGISVYGALHNGEEMARSQLAAFRRYRYDGVFPFMDLSVEAEAMGCELKKTEGEIPTVVKPVGEIEKLQVPEPTKTGRLPVFLEAIEIMSREVGKETTVCAYTTGPFTLATHLRGIANLLLDCRRNREGVHKVLEITKEVGITYARALIHTGSKVIMILEPSAALVSALHFREFVLPYLSKITSFIAREGALSILHICGNSSHLLNEMAETGTNGMSIDSPVDLRQAREKLGHRVCLMGNLPPVRVLLEGSPKDVESNSRECIMKGGRSGFILSSGCEVPKETKPENIETMVRVARELSASKAP